MPQLSTASSGSADRSTFTRCGTKCFFLVLVRVPGPTEAAMATAADQPRSALSLAAGNGNNDQLMPPPRDAKGGGEEIWSDAQLGIPTPPPRGNGTSPLVYRLSGGVPSEAAIGPQGQSGVIPRLEGNVLYYAWE